MNCIVLIPAYNEELSVADVVSEVIAATGYSVVVIDDASTDRTIEYAEAAGATVLPLAAQLGAWGAMQAGIRYALSQGYQFAITMDADGQHKVKDLPAVCAPVFNTQFDVVIGACIKRGSIPRKIAWGILKILSGLLHDDITSGFRAYNLASMKLLAGREGTLLDYQDVGVLALLRMNGMRVGEVSVEMSEREAGHSRVFSSWINVIHYMYYTSILGLSKRSRRAGRKQ